MPHDDVILSPRTSAWSVRAPFRHPARPLAGRPDGRRCSSPRSATARTATPRPGRRSSALGARRRHRCSPPTSPPAPPARSPPCPCRRARTPCGGSCSSASDDGSDRAWRTAGAAVGRATRGAGEVVHAVGDSAPAVRSPAYVESVVLASWASPRWTREGAVAGCEPGSDGRRHRHGGCRGRASERWCGRARSSSPAGWRRPPRTPRTPPGWPRQARTVARRSRPRGAGVGRAPAAGRTGSAASSRSARARPPRRGWCGSTTSPPARRRPPRAWCSSARASPSTPAACRSSRSTACSA